MSDEVEYNLPPELHHTFMVKDNEIFIRPYLVGTALDALVLMFRFIDDTTLGIAGKRVKEIVLIKLVINSDKVYTSPTCSLLDDEFDVFLSHRFIELLSKYTEIGELNESTQITFKMKLCDPTIPILTLRRKEVNIAENVISLVGRCIPTNAVVRDLQEMSLADWGRELCRTKFISKDNLPDVAITRIISQYSDEQMETMGHTIFGCIEEVLKVLDTTDGEKGGGT